MEMRLNRVKKVGGVYHCMSRVVAGEYLLDEGAKKVLCKQLFDVADFCGVEVMTYCLMSNHFHVLVRVPERVELGVDVLLERAEKLYWGEDNALKVIRKIFDEGDADRVEELREQLLARMFDVSIFMKELKQRFSIWYNKTYGRYGVFWADRFKSVLVEGKRHSVEMVAAYIDLNPVRAGLVKDPKDYRYSGYAEAMAGVYRSRKGLMMAMYENDDWKAALEGYRELLFGKGDLGDGLSDSILNNRGKLSRSELLRCKIRYFSQGLIVGTEAFVLGCYNDIRGSLKEKRERKPCLMKGGDWGDLTVFRKSRS